MYVSRADKQLLADLPAEVTIASLLREKLAELRASRAECSHPALELHCPACHHREPAPPAGDDVAEELVDG